MGGNPMHTLGGAGIQSAARGRWNADGTQRNAQRLTAWQKSGIPDGTRHPVAWVMPQKPGGMNARGMMRGELTMTGAGAMGLNAVCAMTAEATLSGLGQLIVSAVCAMSAGATLSASIVGILSASAAMSASGNLVGAVTALGHAVVAMSASGALALTSYARGHMECHIAPATQLEAEAFSAQLLDTELVETGLTVRETLRLIAAATAGKISGGGTATITIRNAVADDEDRIVATVDGSGNRTAITYDLGD